MKLSFNNSMKIAGSIFIIGLFISIFVHYTSNLIIETYQKNLPYISLGDNIKNKTTKGHLWFEEYMAGDEGNDFQKDILANFTGSKEIIQKAMNGGKTSMGEFEVCTDPALRSLFEKTIVDI